MKINLYLLLALSSVAVKSSAQFWSNVGNSGLFDEPVYALYTDSATNALYVGGDFVSPDNYISKWDGTNFSSLGTGMNGDVFSITKYNGNIYAGGAFLNAGGSPASNIAKWNGSAWSPLALGTNGQVNTMVVFNGELFIGGSFTLADAVTANYIAKWNGTAWASVGAGMNALVNCLAVYNNELYAGGQFTTAGGSPANYIAKWNGSSWSAVGSGMDNQVQGLHTWNGELYAGGFFLNAGGSAASYCAKWNGSTWSPLGTGTDMWVNSFQEYNGELYVSGNFNSAGGVFASNIAKWNGANWSSVGSGVGGESMALSVYKGQLYVSGYINDYLERWDNIPPGTIMFQKVYEGLGGNEFVYSGIEQLDDWGYILSGATQSYGAGSSDMFVTRTDTTGNISWSQVWGGTAYDGANAVTMTTDGGIVVAGLTQSFGAGSGDMFAMQMDKDGNVSWQRTYGGSAGDAAWGVKQTSDGGFIIGGTSASDALLVKIFAWGDTIWTRKYGSAQTEGVYSLELSKSGGYLLTGYTGSFPNYNVYVLNVNANGTLLWDKSIGGGAEDIGYRTKQTSDGGFIVAGRTKSFGAGSIDGYLIKLNSAGNTSWSKTYGGFGDEELHDVYETSDGGYLLMGNTGTFGNGSSDVYVVKTTSNGTMQWSKTFGGTNTENTPWQMIQTHDKGFAIITQTNSFPYTGGIDGNLYLIKTDSLLNTGSCYQTAGGGTSSSPATVSGPAGGSVYKSGISVNSPFSTQNNAPFTVYELNLTVSHSQVNVSCNNGTNGQASVTASNGIPPYTFSWSSGGTTSSITNISAGNYTITVSDKAGCAITNTLTVTQPNALSFANSTFSVTCFGGNNGAIDITIAGGTSPYTFLWSNSASTEDISGLTAGNYSFTVTDANGCTKNNTYAVNQPLAVTASISVSNVSCNGGSNGSITSSASGGVPPYSYLWSNTQTTSSATGLSAAAYSLTITDANSCTASFTASVSQPTSLTATVSVILNASCFNNDGSASVTANGGTTPYAYLWSGGQTTSVASALGAGSYTASVTDSKGCSFSGVAVINNSVLSPAHPICAITVDSLSKYNVIVWDKTSYPIADSFFVYRDTANNNYALIGKVHHDSLSQFTDTLRTLYAANGDPNASTWKYKISVKDTCGNISPMSPYHKSLFIQNNSGNFSWNDYQIEGQPVPVPALQNYLFQRDNLSNGTWVTIQTLSASSLAYTDGAYSTYQNTATWRVITTWTISCTPTIVNPKDPMLNATTVNTSKSNTFKTITALTTSLSVTDASSCSASDGNIIAHVSGGVAPYTYLWNPSAQTTSAAIALAMGNYTVTVTDAHNSLLTTTATVSCPNGTSELSFQNSISISPNPNSGQFKIQSSEFIQSLEVFNVYGEKVYYEKILNPNPLKAVGGAEPSLILSLDTPNGIYFLKMISAKGIAVKKIVIAR